MIQNYLVKDNIVVTRNTIGNIIKDIDKDIKEYTKLKKEGEYVDFEILLLQMFKEDLNNLIKRYAKLDVVILGEKPIINI